MLNRFLHLSLARKAASITAVLATLACIVIVLASYQGNRQLVQKSAALFGESLIQQLSRDAANPLVQDDKLSLQALLNELVNSPMVLHAVIYDVENRPITEAGQQRDGLSLSASITFQDSIAGYAVITLDSLSLQQQTNSLAWQLIALTALLAVLIYWLSAIPARHISAVLDDLTVIAARPPGKNNLHIAYRGNDELQRLAKQIMRGPEQNHFRSNGCAQMAVLSLQVANLKQLLQQLGETATMEHVADCYKQLAIIGKLYDGQINISGFCRFNVYFYPTDNEDSYPFRALCSGYLIQQWVTNDNSPLAIDIGLALKSSVAANPLCDELAVLNTAEQANVAGRYGAGLVAATDTLCNHPSVQQRVSTHQTDSEASVYIIDKLVEPYHELLIRQLTTLSTQQPYTEDEPATQH